MSWAQLLRDRRVTKLPPSKVELDNLRSIVARSLSDAAAANLSADAQPALPYCFVKFLERLGWRIPYAVTV